MSDNTQTSKQDTALAPIAKQNLGFMNPKSFDEALAIAERIKNSPLLPDSYRGKPGEIVIVAQLAQELDIPFIQATQGIAVINGKPGVYGDLMLALCRRSQAWEDMKETLDENRMVATCTVKRRGQSETVRQFSKADAELAGLWGGHNWKKYPKRMLQMRARAFALRDTFADVLKGLYMAEELMDGIVEADYTVVAPQAEVVVVEEVTAEQLADLREKIKAANTDEVKMCEVLKIDTLDAMTPAQYGVILNIVEKRLERIQAEQDKAKAKKPESEDNTVKEFFAEEAKA